MAGALGNCYDRLRLGHVRDFVHFHVDPIGFDCAIFNFADNMLVVGAVTLVLLALRPDPETSPSPPRPNRRPLPETGSDEFGPGRTPIFLLPSRAEGVCLWDRPGRRADPADEPGPVNDPFIARRVMGGARE